LAFGVVTSPAVQRASLEEDGSAHSGAIVNREALYVEDGSGDQGASLSLVDYDEITTGGEVGEDPGSRDPGKPGSRPPG